ncbi:hypothetical protein [Paenibacillus sp. JNUCC31]|uniref:hypothetical protein n=1 Tax=Paenibacillus sp. JNUCC-31 TaxID=2777983 RepID=UPI001E5B3D58|nr:hypothetical protein [Paenibacillus sp. JNUCC-31]
MLTRTPDMVEWGLMEDVDPADYFGKTIEVERFKAIGSLAIQLCLTIGQSSKRTRQQY